MKNTISKLHKLFLFISLLGFAISCTGQKDKLRTANAIPGNHYLDSLRVAKASPGISAAIAVKGKTIWEYGSGFSNISEKKKASPNTVYRIASVSKLITTAAIAKMVQNKRLDFSDDVNDYFRLSDQKISIEQVLSHTSGIRHYRYNEKVENYPHYDNVVDATAVFINDPLEFNPGEKFGYSSYGIDLLGAIIEKVSKQSFDKYVQDHVLKPLKMESTFLRPPQSSHQHLSEFYANEQNLVPDIDLSYNIPGGGMYSTVKDLVAFGNAFLSDDYISRPIKEKLFTKAKLNNGNEVNYGLGWIVQKMDDGSEVYYHDGHMDGTHSILAIYPKYHLSIAMISNRGSNWGLPEALDFSCRVYGIEKCPEIIAEQEKDPQFIMQMFQNLSANFDDFRNAISTGNQVKLEQLLASNFKSDSWPDKKAFIAFLMTLGNEHEVYDVDISVKGMNNGDKAFIKNLRFQEHYKDKSWYLIYTLYEDQWLISSIEVFE